MGRGNENRGESGGMKNSMGWVGVWNVTVVRGGGVVRTFSVLSILQFDVDKLESSNQYYPGREFQFLAY